MKILRLRVLLLALLPTAARTVPLTCDDRDSSAERCTCPPLNATSAVLPCQLAALGHTYRPSDTIERWRWIRRAIVEAQDDDATQTQRSNSVSRDGTTCDRKATVAPATAPAVFLEYGSGTGVFSVKLARHFPHSLVVSAEVDRGLVATHRALSLRAGVARNSLVCHTAFVAAHSSTATSGDAADSSSSASSSTSTSTSSSSTPTSPVAVVDAMLRANCYEEGCPTLGAGENPGVAVVDIGELLGDGGGAVGRGSPHFGGRPPLVDFQLLLSTTHWWGLLDREAAVVVHGQLFALARITFLELPSSPSNGGGGRTLQTGMLRSWYEGYDGDGDVGGYGESGARDGDGDEDGNGDHGGGNDSDNGGNGVAERALIDDALEAQGLRKHASVRLLGVTKQWRRRLWMITHNHHGLSPRGSCKSVAQLMGCAAAVGGEEDEEKEEKEEEAVAKCERFMMSRDVVVHRDAAREAHDYATGQLPKAALVLKRGPPSVAKLFLFLGSSGTQQHVRATALSELLASLVDRALGFSRTVTMVGRYVPCHFVPEFLPNAVRAVQASAAEAAVAAAAAAEGINILTHDGSYAKEAAEAAENDDESTRASFLENAIRPWERPLLAHSGLSLRDGSDLGPCGGAPVTMIRHTPDMETVTLPPRWEEQVFGLCGNSKDAPRLVSGSSSGKHVLACLTVNGGGGGVQHPTTPSSSSSSSSGEAGTNGTNEEASLLSFRHEVSDLLVFDYIVGNPDRWNGRNLKARRGVPGTIVGSTTSPAPFVFWDNDRAFDHNTGLYR